MLGATKNRALRVNLLDISPHNKAILEFFFAGAGKSLFKLSNEADADAFIVDFDHPNARKNWEEKNETLNKPTMALAFHEFDVENTVWLSKPLTTNALTTAAASIQGLLTDKPRSMSTSGLKSTLAKLPPINAAPNASQLKKQMQEKLNIKKASATTPPASQANPVQTNIPLVTSITDDDQDDDDKEAEDVTTAENKESTATQESTSVAPQKQQDSKADNSETKKKPPATPSTPEIPLEIKEKRWKKLCGEQDNIQNPEIWKSESELFTPENYIITSLQDALRLATQSRQMVQIKHHDSVFYFIPEGSQAYSSVDLNAEAFESLCSTPVKKTDVVIHIMDTKEVEQAKETLEEEPESVYDLENFMWTSMLLTSAGRLHRNIDLPKRVMLKHWPNLTRLESFPHVVRISALWANDPLNMLEVAHNLDIPQRYVFSFYNAACTLGLIETDAGKLKAKTQETSQQTSNNNRGLFSRLLKRLIG